LTFATFTPPPYPYARLSQLAEIADCHEGGIVDLSVGTPCDPAPKAAVEALGRSGAENGYPSSVGSERLRSAAAAWMERRFGVEIDPAQVAACVGTKEFVASTAWYLRLRDPSRHLVIAPETAYPTYELGARIAGCELVAVPESEKGGVDLRAVPRSTASRAVLAWINSPSNPTGSLSNLQAAAEWGVSNGVPVFSDECYCEFTWSATPSSVLQAAVGGVVAVHSLSKRSNFAGARVGFYAGDAALVDYLKLIRQHAGLMVPGPVQAAAAVAFDDDEHVLRQRELYERRLQRLIEIFRSAGLDAGMPDGGFYLWVPVPGWARVEGSTDEGPAWVLARSLAEAAGTLVSPGDLYGESGAGHVRVAAVQPEDRIELLAKRLARSDHPHLRLRHEGLR
jgi:succinyldiaminopimelate transaminase